jgi:hypothetical protein
MEWEWAGLKTTKKSYSKKSSNHLAILLDLLDICGFLLNIRVPYDQHKRQTYCPTYNTWIYAKHNKPWWMLKSTSKEANIHKLDFLFCEAEHVFISAKHEPCSATVQNHGRCLTRVRLGGGVYSVACVIIQDLFICHRLWMQNEWNAQQSCSNPLSLAFHTELNI